MQKHERLYANHEEAKKAAITNYIHHLPDRQGNCQYTKERFLSFFEVANKHRRDKHEGDDITKLNIKKCKMSGFQKILTKPVKIMELKNLMRKYSIVVQERVRDLRLNVLRTLNSNKI